MRTDPTQTEVYTGDKRLLMQQPSINLISHTKAIP